MSTPTALVTGASGSIGSTLADQLVDEGWTVYGTYHRHPDSLPDSIRGLEADFTQPPATARTLRDRIAEQTTSLECIVHAAGPVRDRTLVSMNDDEWNTVRRTHLDAAFYLARAFHPLLQKSERPGDRPPHYVLIGSQVALSGAFGQSNYAAAKAGLLGFMASLAAEWAPDILVNAIRPPLTDSRMVRAIPDDVLATIKQRTLTNRIASPAQTARTVLDLIGHDNVCGQFLTADNRTRSFWG